MIGFAASAQPYTYASFPESTFNFTNVASIVGSVVPTGVTELVTVDVTRFQAGQTEAKSTRINLEKSAVVSLYSKGLEKARLDGTVVEQLWKRWPPFPHSQPNDRTR